MYYTLSYTDFVEYFEHYLDWFLFPSIIIFFSSNSSNRLFINSSNRRLITRLVNSFLNRLVEFKSSLTSLNSFLLLTCDLNTFKYPRPSKREPIRLGTCPIFSKKLFINSSVYGEYGSLSDSSKVTLAKRLLFQPDSTLCRVVKDLFRHFLNFYDFMNKEGNAVKYQINRLTLK